MARDNRVTEELAWLRTSFIVLAGVFASLMAWATVNLTLLDGVILWASTAGLVALIVSIAIVVRTVYHLLDELEGL